MFFECAMSERICWTRYTIIFRNEMANFRAKTTKREEVNTTYSLESVSCLQPKINHCSRKGYCVAGLTASSMAFWCFAQNSSQKQIYSRILCVDATTKKFGNSDSILRLTCRSSISLLHFLLFFCDFFQYIDHLLASIGTACATRAVPQMKRGTLDARRKTRPCERVV